MPETVKTTKVNGQNKKDVLIKTKKEFEDKWEISVEALKKTIKSLSNQNINV